MLCRYCNDPMHAHDLDQRAQGRIVPGPGISAEQRRIEREAELAARDDSETSSSPWRGFAAAVVIQLLMALFIALVLGVVMGGCGRMQPVPAAITIPAAPKKAPEILVLSERVGGTVAEIIEAATGQHPFAAAAPGLPIIVFSPKDATDYGLIAHELCHQRQQADMGPLRWSAVYVRDLAECERITARAVCLRTVPLEAECYWVQRGVNR
jgi:hypothetical protein